MRLSNDQVQTLRQWAAENGNVRELWLFGSRIREHPVAKDDVDLAIELMPATKKHNSALGNYTRFGDDWQRELASLIGIPVSLEAIMRGTPEDDMVRRMGILLWKWLK